MHFFLWLSNSSQYRYSDNPTPYKVSGGGSVRFWEWIWADEVCTDKRCRLLTEDAYKRMVKEAKGLK